MLSIPANVFESNYLQDCHFKEALLEYKYYFRNIKKRNEPNFVKEFTYLDYPFMMDLFFK
jgi:hypothetical protein